MNILLTGASGFIGKNLAEALKTKYNILTPSHSELELLDEDAVRDYFNKNSIDIVIHCAVRPGHRNAKDTSNQLFYNTRMFFNLIRNRDKFKKMIVVSSGLIYDIRYYLPKMEEDYFDTHVPVDEGGLSKYIIAKYIEKCDNVTELRVFSIFGKYEDYAIRFISNLICKALFDLPLTMKQNRRFDFIYIDDFIPIIEYFIKNEGEYKCYNAAPDNSVELFALAERIRMISEKNLPVLIEKSGMGVEYSGCNKRLRKEIKNLSFTPIDEAIRKLYNWYAENKHTLNKEVLLFDK